MNYGKDIIELLKEQGFKMDKLIENTINMLAYQVHEDGEKEGFKKGVNMGKGLACKEIEDKILNIRSQLGD